MTHPAPTPSKVTRLPAWVVLLISTQVTLGLAALSSMYIGLTSIDCGSGSTAEMDACYGDLALARDMYHYGLLLPAACLIAAACRPGRRVRYAVLAPATVVALYVAFNLLMA